MTIIEALKLGRIDFIPKAGRWLYFAHNDSYGDEENHFVVRIKLKNKAPRVLIITQDEEEAVRYLLGEKE